MANDDPKTGTTPENAGPGEAPAADGAAATEAAAETAALEAQVRDLKDQLLRSAADFDNYRKRIRREVDEAAAKGRESLLKELLPVLDNLERALQHAPENDPLTVGVRSTERQLLQALEKFGVTRFNAVGQPFDPNRHEAIQQVETNQVAPGVVAQEFASGYMMNGRLLRAAMVAVAKAPPAEAAPAPDGGDVIH